MKSFSLYIPADLDLLEMVVKRRGWGTHSRDELSAIREDYDKVSGRQPILAVADGVTLRTQPGMKYPSPSGPGEVAKLFTETAVEEAEKAYESIDQDALVEIFRAANTRIGEYNTECGVNEDTINYWDEDYYATTGGLAIVKNRKLYWATLCDTRVAHMGKDGEMLFLSEDGYEFQRRNRPANWDEMSPKEKWIYNRKKRNVIEKDGSRKGYGVLTGEDGALAYLQHGVRDVNDGDIVLVFSDGFTNYLEKDSILKALVQWAPHIESALRSAVHEVVRNGKKNRETVDLYDFLYDFGSERTVAGVNVG